MRIAIHVWVGWVKLNVTQFNSVYAYNICMLGFVAEEILEGINHTKQFLLLLYINNIL